MYLDIRSSVRLHGTDYFIVSEALLASSSPAALSRIALSDVHSESRKDVRDLVEDVQTFCMRDRDLSDDRRLHSLTQRAQLSADQIVRVDLAVHPLVLELTEEKTPADRSRRQVQRLFLPRRSR